MQLFYSSFLTLLLLTPTGLIAAETKNDSDVAQTYPPEFVSDYSQECMQTSMTEGLTATEAETLCNCTINEFQRQYTLKEFKELTAASATDETAENTLIEVGQICFESILYEQ